MNAQIANYGTALIKPLNFPKNASKVHFSENFDEKWTFYHHCGHLMFWLSEMNIPNTIPKCILLYILRILYARGIKQPK